METITDKKTYQFDTCDDLLHYAIKIARERKSECPEFLDWYIHHIMESNPNTKYAQFDAAKEAALKNIGYWAGYYGPDVQEIVRKEYGARHPYLR